ncbi:MAG: hypothetical protein A2283_23755 [Lentisphaerae bacterium RIFOXYA12_FULL_48_11]|nr:MAG: hypothetical protein A2283_23755 [Lentisphaerae bacterium RIFOXYA12_FULL_48_11]
MSRPVSIDAKAILEAARVIFLKNGYSASTKQIAKKAGISEGSLFKHFKTKTDLFMSAMEDDDGIISWEEKLMGSAGKGNIRSNLESVGLQVLRNLQVVLPRIMMVRSSGIMLQGQDYTGSREMPHPVRKLYALANYFRAEVKCGRLVMDNPELGAQMFLGTLVYYVFQQVIFSFRIVTPEKYVCAVVEMFMAMHDGGSFDKVRKGSRK